MTDAPTLPPEMHALDIPERRPLLVVDVDEVLAMFMRGFERFLWKHDLEMRIDRFALFQNIYRPGESKHLDVAAGRALFEAFFESDVEDIEVAPGAVEALRRIAKDATVVVFTNAPLQSREARTRWLHANGMPYPMLVGQGPKGPCVGQLSARAQAPVAFIDDLLPNLDSVAESAPAVHTFQHVADERLRPLAFTAPDRHRRIDHWPALGDAVAEALGLESR